MFRKSLPIRIVDAEKGFVFVQKTFSFVQILKKYREVFYGISRYFFMMSHVLPSTSFTLVIDEGIILPAVTLLLPYCEGGEGLKRLKFFFILGS